MDKRLSTGFRVLVLNAHARSIATKNIDQSSVPPGWLKIATESFTPGISLPGNTTRVPHYLNSAEALQFCFIREQKAREIYDVYRSWQASLRAWDAEYQEPVIKFARGYTYMTSLAESGRIPRDTLPNIMRSAQERSGGRACPLTIASYQQTVDCNLRWDEDAVRTKKLWNFLRRLNKKIIAAAEDAEERANKHLDKQVDQHVEDRTGVGHDASFAEAMAIQNPWTGSWTV